MSSLQPGLIAESRRATLADIVAVIRTPDSRAAEVAAWGLLDAGVERVEVTLTVPNAESVIRSIRNAGGTVGAGTVVHVEQVARLVDAGASFIVSPSFDPEVVQAAIDLGVPAYPGAATPTEIVAAWKAGATGIKIFPVHTLGGPEYIKSVREPLPQVPLLASGGVSVSNLSSYLEAGAVAGCIGDGLIDWDAARSGDRQLVAEGVRRATRTLGETA